MPLQGALTHWGRVTNICVSKQSIIAFDNGLSPGRRQAIIGSNDGILLIRTLGTKFSEILSKILTFSFKKMWLKVSSAKWRPFCLGLNVLKAVILTSLNGPRDNKTGRAWRPLRSRLFSTAIHINYNEISFTDCFCGGVIEALDTRQVECLVSTDDKTLYAAINAISEMASVRHVTLVTVAATVILPFVCQASVTHLEIGYP